ncbi:DUF6146 family protein [Fulvivirgaceae bacterium BMA12]|uniref:DUF6146 family protein n=1 Tax=Agaribacillus aureus TaxID=3051825 RepID=A0ABT8LGD1_9BACT|nr:DUF6146 family protein [Fulvivirgaceae bacterium BMA12]
MTIFSNRNNTGVIKVLSFSVLIFLMGCAGGAPSRILVKGSNIIDPKPEDEVEYQLIVDDPGYETWLITNARPIGYYSLSYYEAKNRIYVTDWNAKVVSLSSRRNSPFTEQINYDFNTDYGLELNYRLFNYFKFIHQRYGRRYAFPE